MQICQSLIGGQLVASALPAIDKIYPKPVYPTACFRLSMVRMRLAGRFASIPALPKFR
jgi:hypothetical protein